MTLQEIKDYLIENDCEESTVFENPSFESAFIGLSENNQVIYDYDLMIEYLIKDGEMDLEEASDYISYSIIRFLGSYINPPIILFRKMSD